MDVPVFTNFTKGTHIHKFGMESRLFILQQPNWWENSQNQNGMPANCQRYFRQMFKSGVFTSNIDDDESGIKKGICPHKLFLDSRAAVALFCPLGNMLKKDLQFLSFQIVSHPNQVQNTRNYNTNTVLCILDTTRKGVGFCMFCTKDLVSTCIQSREIWWYWAHCSCIEQQKSGSCSLREHAAALKNQLPPAQRQWQ